MSDIVLEGDRPRSRPLKAAELVAAEIRAGIAGGGLPEGGRLPPQEELANHYGVSAPTMREALRMLEADGLVTVVRGVHGGTIVNAPNLDAMSRQLCMYLQQHAATIADMYVARLAIEPPAVRLLAARCTPAIEAELRGCVDDEREAQGNARLLGAIGARFHNLLLRHSGNVTLGALGTVIAGIVESNLAASVIAQGLADRVAALAAVTVKDYERLVKLVAAHDGAGAERHWRKVLEEQSKFVAQFADVEIKLAALT